MPFAPPWLMGNVCVPVYVPPLQVVVVWHAEQVVPKELVCDEGLEWQAEHVVGVPR